MDTCWRIIQLPLWLTFCNFVAIFLYDIWHQWFHLYVIQLYFVRALLHYFFLSFSLLLLDVFIPLCNSCVIFCVKNFIYMWYNYTLSEHLFCVWMLLLPASVFIYVRRLYVRCLYFKRDPFSILVSICLSNQWCFLVSVYFLRPWMNKQDHLDIVLMLLLLLAVDSSFN